MRLRLILSLILLVSAAAPSLYAQDGMKIAKLFSPEFQDQKGVTAIHMEGNNINEWGDLVSVYRSLTVTNPEHIQAIQDAVKADGRNATTRTSSSHEGHITYGWYGFSNGKNNLERYIILLSPPGKDLPTTLIYIEGTINPTAFKHYILQNLPIQ